MAESEERWDSLVEVFKKNALEGRTGIVTIAVFTLVIILSLTICL